MDPKWMFVAEANELKQTSKILGLYTQGTLCLLVVSFYHVDFYTIITYLNTS